MDQRLFQVEDEKYSHLWAHGYRSARWKVLASRVVKRARTISPAPRILDFGCGKGDALRFFEARGFEAAGVDISAYAVDRLRAQGKVVHQAALDSLTQFRDREFDIGFSNDVLEHVPEHLVEESLAEMSRVCSRFLFVSICPVPSRNRSREGDNLHLTVRPKAWWEERMSRLGKIEELKVLFNRSLRYEFALRAPRG
jgi:SAM-dependent methyltransferase